MPWKRPYRKRPFRRRPYRRRKLQVKRSTYGPRSVPGGPKRIVSFSRTVVTDLVLNHDSAPSDWTAIGGGSTATDNAFVTLLSFSLDSLGASKTDFTNLFSGWRLKGVRMTAYFSNTQSVNENNNFILYNVRSNFAQATASELTEDWFLQRPTAKKRTLLNRSSSGKVMDLYFPLNQLKNTYAGVVNTDYAMVRPSFISTKETSTPHYGVALHLRRIDGKIPTADTENQYPTLKVYYKLYFQVRGIK